MEFTTEQAREIGKQIGINWNTSKFDVRQFKMGLHIELEHGTHDPQTDVTGDDPVKTGKVALAHLKEYPDYYDRLAAMEGEAATIWGLRNNDDDDDDDDDDN